VAKKFIRIVGFGPWHIRRDLCIGDWTYCGRPIGERHQQQDGLPTVRDYCKTCERLAVHSRDEVIS
jgi:hypothetical protein